MTRPTNVLATMLTGFRHHFIRRVVGAVAFFSGIALMFALSPSLGAALLLIAWGYQLLNREAGV